MIEYCDVFHRLELHFKSAGTYRHPFIEVTALAEFHGPDGAHITQSAFFDGDDTWTVRFVPHAAGLWHYRMSSFPEDGGLCASGDILVEECDAFGKQGFLRAFPGEGWGLRFDGGEDLLVIGDTMYNLFGAAYCGVDVRKILDKRKAQGHNLIRVKFNPTPFQFGFKTAPWYNRPAYPWAGTPEMPDYAAFNLEYFRAVDIVLELCEEFGIGVELIVMPFSYELPMTDRVHFLPEHQELYVRYIVSRCAAYKSLYFWDVANEYNQYALGLIDFFNGPLEELVCARYAERIAGLIRRDDAYRHPVGVHDTASGSAAVKPLKERFNPRSGIDVLFFQSWGSLSDRRGKAFCSGLDQAIRTHVWSDRYVGILAEYGYEHKADLASWPDFAKGLGPAHTRRGAWRALMSGVHVLCGYENTSVTVLEAENDVPGVKYIRHMRDFFNSVVDFSAYRPNDGLALDKLEQEKPEDERTLCLADADASSVVAYLPAGGRVGMRYAREAIPDAFWFDPISGALAKAEASGRTDDCILFAAPPGTDEDGYGKDWTLLLNKGLAPGADGRGVERISKPIETGDELCKEK
ncbi:MAG: DUF4038 domain-containing protein [Clostridiales bacterium]|jgi:hypothetical protein|nr:DUF4038 domain-containing protein [Clostridiales bacterium]